MAAKTVLRGITWNHSRGFVSVLATAQRFSEMRPGVEITWGEALAAGIRRCPNPGLGRDL